MQIVTHAFYVRKQSFGHSDELLCRHDSTLADLNRYASTSFHLLLYFCDRVKKVTKSSSIEARTGGIENAQDGSVTSVWVTFRRNRNSCRRLFALCLGSEPAEFTETAYNECAQRCQKSCAFNAFLYVFLRAWPDQAQFGTTGIRKMGWKFWIFGIPGGPQWIIVLYNHFQGPAFAVFVHERER